MHIMNCIGEEPKKIFTTLAIIIPIKPIKRNDPSLASDLFVTYPYRLAPKNVEEEIKKTLNIDSPVYCTKIFAKNIP